MKNEMIVEMTIELSHGTIKIERRKKHQMKAGFPIMSQIISLQIV